MDSEKLVVDLVVKKCSGIKHMDIDRSTPLSSLPMGSLKVLEIIHDIESRYGIHIEERELFEIENVGDLVNLIPVLCNE